MSASPGKPTASATIVPADPDAVTTTSPAPQASGAASAVPCTATSGLALPAGWPSDLPLPPGLVVTYTQGGTGGRLITIGRVPGDFHAVVAFWNTQLPAAGYTQHDGQLDPADAESDFSGSARQGRWAAGRSPDCPGTTKVTVVVQPLGASPGGASPVG